MWLLQPEIVQQIHSAISTGFTPSAEQISAFAGGQSPRIMSRNGSTATISIKGALTQTPNFFAMLFGGGNTTYSDIISAIEAANADDTIQQIDFYVDSPGGSVDGLFETLAAIEASTKPTRSIVSAKAASAAFAIVAATDRIEATSKAARFGSVGIVADIPIDDSYVSITSTDAPNKRPDVRTEEGVAVVREELDALHEIFVESIANGRGVSIDKVNADFGRGGMFLAGEALKRGMIDAVSTNAIKTQTTNPKGEKAMDLQTLKAQHPDVFAAAVQCGVDQERERVNAHLIMADATGALNVAIEAIQSGSDMTPTINAKYVAAGINRQNVEDRQKETQDANPDADESDADKDAKVGQSILALAAERCGVEITA